MLRSDFNNLTFVLIVENLQNLIRLEAMYGTPQQYTSAVSELVDYYKQVQLCTVYVHTTFL